MQPLTQQLDRDYALDVAAFQTEFSKVNTTNLTQLKHWFTTHLYLTAADNARIAQVAVSTIYRWRARAGLDRHHPAPAVRPPRSVRTDPSPPVDWQDTSWLEDSYRDGYSIPQLARATNRSYTAIRKRLKRRLGELRDAREAVKSKHPCCNRVWLLKHYVVQQLSVQRCAKLAVVSRLTMMCWLTASRIRLRSNSEQTIINDIVAQTSDRPPRRLPPKRRGV